MGQTKEWIINHLAERIDAEIIYHKQLTETQQKSETMKQSKITSVQGTGTFKDLFKFEIAFENGDVGTMFKKSQNPFVAVGDRVEYEITDSGKGHKIAIKNKLDAPNNPAGSQPQSTTNDFENREFRIVRQSQLKMAFDILTASGNVGDDPHVFASNVIDMCEILTKYVMNGK